MANVLIADVLEASAYLVRSLIRGRGHAASIAVSPEEARAKLETGLFDTLVVDLCTPEPAALAIAQAANDLLPGMPVVALVREETENRINGIELFGKFRRPIKGSEVNRAVDRAIAHALGLGARRKSPRLEIDIPLTVRIDGGTIPARVSDISPRGFAIDCGAEATTLTAACSGMLSGSSRLDATFAPKGGQSFTVSGRVAFVDRSRRAGNRMIGVVFDDMEPVGRAWVESLFAPSAQSAAEPLAQAA